MNNGFEKNVGEAPVSQEARYPLSFKLRDKAVKSSNIDDNSIETRHLKDSSIDMSKLAPEVQDFILSKVSTLDDKYTDIVDNIYEQIRSLQIHGVALSSQLGDSENIGINQKTLTRIINSIIEKIGTITGETFGDPVLTVTPPVSFSESNTQITVSVSYPGYNGTFDSVQLFINDVLVDEQTNIAPYTFTYSLDHTSTVKAIATVVGRPTTKTVLVIKEPPFFIGAGGIYDDIFNVNHLINLDNSLEGNYDLSVDNDGDYIFVIIPASRKNELRRVDMNGYEIPMNSLRIRDFIVYRSINRYKRGVYNIDIDVNS